MTSPTFGEQVKQHRHRLGISQRALADFLGWSERQVWSWEHGTEPRPGVRAAVLGSLERASVTPRKIEITKGDK